MRLRCVERGHSFLQKLRLGVVRWLMGHRAPDIVRVLFYRPELFGQRFSACLQRAMRGPSAWSIGERELFAAFISRLNRCAF